MMPKLTVTEIGVFQVPTGKRLVNALVDECGIDQLHACGGFGRCTTCRVEFVSGEPSKMTVAEKETLMKKGLADTEGLRLSCQITCDADMEIKAMSHLAGSGRENSGARPPDDIQPPPEWV